jgi:PhnB protein
MTDSKIVRGVIPYLTVVGASNAVDFYKKAFAAIEHDRRPTDDGRLMHCHLEINDGSLMLSDAFPEHGHAHQPSTSFTMTMIVADAGLWWDRAVAAGCGIKMQLDVQFWGDRYGQLEDPFGVRWAINEPGEKT